MRTVCKENMCTGCMACIESCPKQAITIKDTLSAYNAIINEEKCVNCNICSSVCQVCSSVLKIKPLDWYQGWSSNNSLRLRSSSGGAGTSIANGFVGREGIVCSCSFVDGNFNFDFASSEDEVRKFTGSKYFKSNPTGIYKRTKDFLKQKKRVLFIGLPCQVAALKKYVGEDLSDLLYTVDLICHGSPSPKLLDYFFEEYGISLSDINDISFRKKTRFKLFNDYKKVIPDTVQDTYTYAFLSSLDYTENCYSCQYACGERVGDVTIGDAWGTELSKAEQRQGISLLIIQTKKGRDLVKWSDMHLEPIDSRMATEANHQLVSPSLKHPKRELFFKMISNGSGFNKTIAKCCRNVLQTKDKIYIN